MGPVIGIKGCVTIRGVSPLGGVIIATKRAAVLPVDADKRVNESEDGLRMDADF